MLPKRKTLGLLRISAVEPKQSLSFNDFCLRVRPAEPHVCSSDAGEAEAGDHRGRARATERIRRDYLAADPEQSPGMSLSRRLAIRDKFDFPA